MNLLQNLYADTLFRLATLTWLEGLDLLMVTASFYLVLSLVRQSRAAFLVRGVLVLTIVFFIFIILLPLPAFNWLLIGALGAMLIATPVLFHPELRHLLERLGRSAGLGRTVRQTEAEIVSAALVHAVENMSTTYTGALIALEGNSSLQEVIETGVMIEGRVSSELLQAIFYPENPLHDGAVIVRADRVVAASCVLPLTQTPLPARRRLGTRHRAAVGLSEQSDALVIVVSEETGIISAARHGQLRRPLDGATLRRELFDFYTPAVPSAAMPSFGQVIRQLGRQVWQSPSLPPRQRLWSNLSLLLISLILAVETWTFIVGQTNPARQVALNNIPLRITGEPAGTTLLTSPPASVRAVIQTTADIEHFLNADSFQALVSLSGLEPGLYQLPVHVNSNLPGEVRTQVLSIEPATLELELAAIISRTEEVRVQILNLQNLSPAYQLAGTPVVSPAQVQVIGAEPLVEQVSQVRAPISLADAATQIQEVRPLQAVNELGQEVEEVTLQPDQAQVSLTITRRLDAREVGVRVETSGTPPPGYELGGWSVSPNSVTLQGEPDQLSQLGSYVNTTPIDISQVVGNLNVEIPLDLPPGIQALDGRRNTVKTVTAYIRVVAANDNLTVTRPVELLGVTPGITATVTPTRVYLRLSGPAPILNQIKDEPDLIKVVLDGVGLTSGQRTVLTPTLIAPTGIRAEIIPDQVAVMLQ